MGYFYSFPSLAQGHFPEHADDSLRSDTQPTLPRPEVPWHRKHASTESPTPVCPELGLLLARPACCSHRHSCISSFLVSPLSARRQPGPEPPDKMGAFSVRPRGLLTVGTEPGESAEFYDSIPADFPVNPSPGG